MSFFSLGNLLPDTGFNKAKQFEKWTTQVDKGEKTQPYFRVVRNGVVKVSEYKSDLKELSQDYIRLMDTDNDGKISYDEFEKYNEKELKENASDISKEQLQSLKQSLKLIYNRLNVDNENNSKDKLDYREIMNYFYTMDTNNDNDMTADGNVTQEEYFETGLMLSDKSNVGNTLAKYMKATFEDNFKDYK